MPPTVRSTTSPVSGCDTGSRSVWNVGTWSGWMQEPSNHDTVSGNLCFVPRFIGSMQALATKFEHPCDATFHSMELTAAFAQHRQLHVTNVSSVPNVKYHKSSKWNDRIHGSWCVLYTMPLNFPTVTVAQLRISTRCRNRIGYVYPTQ